MRFVVVAFLASCSSLSPSSDGGATVCVPRQLFACTCPDGSASTQSCAADGSWLQPCECGTDLSDDMKITRDMTTGDMAQCGVAALPAPGNQCCPDKNGRTIEHADGGAMIITGTCSSLYPMTLCNGTNCIQCGLQGGPCCLSGGCEGSTVCSSGMCVHCGEQGEPCCLTSPACSLPLSCMPGATCS